MFFLNRNKILRKIFLKIDNNRKNDILRKIVVYLKKEDKILDLGCGNCNVSKDLIGNGYDVTPIDIKNKSFFNDIAPVIYDGKKLPYNNNYFDIVLVTTVLHHTKDPVSVLVEAMRVSKRLIVMEDLYESRVQKYLTFIMDSLVNFEIFGHPHGNKTQKEWNDIFKNLGLKILDVNTHKFWKFFITCTFYLEK